ncbi:MAG: DUF6691 family protein [Bdellovibrionales bacterium]
MKNHLTAAAAGFIFAAGLCISGMTQPEKIFGFLNIFGNWNPALIFVMVGAIAVHFITYRLIRRRSSPLFSKNWYVPEKTNITKSLIIGSLLFGIGWGLGGYCPGPGLVSLASLQLKPLLFVGGMLIGMLVFKILDDRFKFNR